MAPAVHVAVAKLHLLNERTHFNHFLNNQRVGFPDVQAAEEGQGIRIHAVAHHGVDDVGVFHAVGFAG